MPPKKQEKKKEKEEPVKLWPLRPIDKGVIIGPNGINHYVEPEFNIPDGFVAWCFICGRPPFNKTTKIEDVDVPGVGLRTMKESVEHSLMYHNYRKLPRLD